MKGGLAINTEGDVTGHYGTPPSGKMRGFLLRNGALTTFGAEDWGRSNTITCSFGINAGQYIVGHFADGTGTHGFLLTGSVFTPINHPENGATNTQALGINPQEEIVGNYKDKDGKVRGFLRSAWGDFTPVDIPGALGERVARIYSQPLKAPILNHNHQGAGNLGRSGPLRPW